MTKNDLKSGLSNTQARLAELETAARKLQNQNYADIAARAKSCIQQLLDHPDAELVHEKMDGNESVQTVYDENGKPVDSVRKPPFDPNAGRTDGNDVGGPNRGKPDTFVPGAPQFENGGSNANFRNPNAVDLNSDGTLQVAPNSKGAQPDVRTGDTGE